MCRPTRCSTCAETTWAGCGQHIAQVKASVPPGQWCPNTHTTAEKAAARAQRPSGGRLRRLLRG